MSWPGLPVLVTLAGRPVILVGDGEAATAKRRLLERAGATIVDEHPDARLAIVAVEDDCEAEQAVTRLRARGVLVNAVDRPALCDFTLPAVVDRAPVLVAVMTGGVSAGLAAALRQRLEQMLSPKLGALATYLRDWRDDLRRAFPAPDSRRKAIAAALAPGGVLDLEDPWLENPFWIDDMQAGFGSSVSYVRLRSRDPDDMTLREARLLAVADRVYHAANVPEAVLVRARADAPRVPAVVAPSAPPPGLSVWLEMGG